MTSRERAEAIVQSWYPSIGHGPSSLSAAIEAAIDAAITEDRAAYLDAPLLRIPQATLVAWLIRVMELRDAGKSHGEAIECLRTEWCAPVPKQADRAGRESVVAELVEALTDIAHFNRTRSDVPLKPRNYQYAKDVARRTLKRYESILARAKERGNG